MKTKSLATALFKFLPYLSLLLSLLTNSALVAQNSTQALELRIIVVDSAAKADHLLQRLKAGEDFATLAHELSIDPTASDGGYMGRVDPSTLRPELRDALKGLVPGQITAVVREPSGYAIMKVITPGEQNALQNTSPARILPSAATGTIRYAPNVGGKGEADLAFRDLVKPEGWSQNLQAMCKIRQQSLAAVIDSIKKVSIPPIPKASPTIMVAALSISYRCTTR